MYFFKCLSCFTFKKKRKTNIENLKTGTSIYYRENTQDTTDPFL
jgi:hypothetical protein